ncbi:GIY-YIG nuclease family protein, partial [Paraclostridium dentum]|uniref:GIY-YIG nuclease family protein n=1 Tax=Paraclostridium dentum TaxID=2662455 RepID=UPI00197D4648
MGTLKKQCSGCYETKDIKGFSRNKRSEDGFQNYCKECNKAYQKERHFIKNNTWKLYRITIDIRDIVSGRKSYYIGITQKDLKDRLNEHISAIKNKRHKNFWIMEMFKYFPYSQIENINLRDYIKIELLKEYPSTYTKSEMKK